MQLYEKVINKDNIKYKILGIPVKVIRWKANTIKIRLLGLHVWRIKSVDGNLKIYFMGILVVSVKDTIHAPILMSNIQVKALELLNERKDISVEVAQTYA